MRKFLVKNNFLLINFKQYESKLVEPINSKKGGEGEGRREGASFSLSFSSFFFCCFQVYFAFIDVFIYKKKIMEATFYWYEDTLYHILSLNISSLQWYNVRISMNPLLSYSSIGSTSICYFKIKKDILWWHTNLKDEIRNTFLMINQLYCL